MPSPKISIITINYNEPLLERTCASVVGQTFKDYEWIVIDGHSTNPDTLSTLDKYKNHAAYFVSEPDGGRYDAMNKGIARATGDWLIFLNAGDCFYDADVLQKMAEHLNTDEHAVVYGGILAEHKKKPKKTFVDPKTLDDLYFINKSIPHPASFIRRDMFEKYGKYRDEFKIVSDWAKFAQMFWAGERFKHVGEPVAKYNTDGISVTASRDDLYMEHAAVWKESQPWVFDSKTLNSRKRFYRFLRGLFFFGKLHRHFREKYYLYKYLVKYTKMYRERFAKDKLLFVGYAFHKQTKSCDFMVDILRRDFDVEVMYCDDAMMTRAFDVASLGLEKYKYVVFWQNLPKKSLWKLHHKRMYWFPMRDGLIPRNDRRWRRWAKKFKIINFCKDLYDKQSALGIRSLYVRYFPDPREFIPGDPNKVFFWQRLANIDIGNVAKVLPPDGNLSVHLHKALDPNQPFVPPDADAEKKFSITYSEWFPNKSDMTDLIKRAGIYVAPRWMEGIGMSFLEAMAMGKAIIAQDAPTMNEYIENGINGYLVDFGNPEPVDLSDIEWVQKNAHESAQIGYKRWLNDQKKIIKFIKGIK